MSEARLGEWTCTACGTMVNPGEPVCPLCGSSPEELARLPVVTQRRSLDGKPTGVGRLPWFFGFLLLFPPALLVWLIYKLIVWAGRQPLEFDDRRNGE